MSEWLTSSVPPRLALWNISQIDDECEEAPTFEDIQICRGPFGAFRLARAQPNPTRDPLPDWSEDISPPQVVVQTSDDYFSPPGFTLSPNTQQLVQTILDQSEQDPLSSFMDMWNVTMDSGRVEEIFDDLPMPETQATLIAPPAAQSIQFPHFISDAQFNHLIACSSGSLISTVNSPVPQDAVFLLKHYSTTVLRLLTPFGHSKTPWHVLFIPHAKNCLAALTLGEDMDHASLCAFYGTLAISAFSFSGLSQSHTWLEQGQVYEQQAREHARLMLKTAYDVPKTAKYKSILMALLTMVQISMVSGNRDHTECYFLEAEKFIRLKGLNRKKSRKVRLLHHCYAFERIFHESTFICGTNSSHRRHVRKAIVSSGLVVHSQDSLSFRLGDCSNLEQEMLKVKGQEEGENDLHLQLPGIWSATLYPEIFGVPEPWILLVSLVIRLGREKDAAEQQDVTDALSLKDFMSRAKAVERCINRLQRPGGTADAPLNHQPQNPRHALDCMLGAMQHALAIYFYRRVYDVDASMLQQNVVSVRDCLLRFESADPGMTCGSARLIWPAFMAAREAEDPEVQVSFTNWFKDSGQRSGLSFFTDTLSNIEQIWEEKRSGHRRNVTWLDIMRKSVPFVSHP